MVCRVICLLYTSDAADEGLGVDLGGVVIERREGTDHPTHDGHGVRITSETVEEGSDLLMHHGMPVSYTHLTLPTKA